MYYKGFKSFYYVQTDFAGLNIESKMKEKPTVIVFSCRALFLLMSRAFLDTSSSLLLFLETPSTLCLISGSASPYFCLYKGNSTQTSELCEKNKQTKLKARLYLDLLDDFLYLYVFCISKHLNLS